MIVKVMRILNLVRVTTNKAVKRKKSTPRGFLGI